MLEEFRQIQEVVKRNPLIAVVIGANKEIVVAILTGYCEAENSESYFTAMIVISHF